MSTVHAVVLWLGSALLVAGCAGSLQKTPLPAPPAVDRPLSSLHTGRADAAPNAPDGPLALAEALTAAAAHNPNLAAAALEVRAAEADAEQAGARRNPSLGVELENFAGNGDLTGLDDAEATLAWSQPIELGNKRGKRRAVADHTRHLAAWDHETARVEVLTETATAFVQVLAAQQQLALADELVGVAEEMLASVARRVKAGSTSPVEENRAFVELEVLRIERVHAERTLGDARRLLASMWGASTPAFGAAEGSLEDIPPLPSLEVLQQRVERSPALARWATEMERRRAALDLERARGVPDLAVDAGVRYLTGPDDAALIVGLELPLPLFDRNRAAARAATMRLEGARQGRHAATVRLQADIATAHAALAAAGAEVDALRDRAVPAADAAFRKAQEVYARGAMRFTDVLDTERGLYELKRRYVDALSRYHVTFAELERLTGQAPGGAPAGGSDDD